MQWKKKQTEYWSFYCTLTVQSYISLVKEERFHQISVRFESLVIYMDLSLGFVDTLFDC